MTNSLPLQNLGLSLLSDLERRLFLILAAIAETMRALAMALDLALQPNLVAFLVFSPVFPLAAVVTEFRFVDHRYAFLHRAHGFAHATAAAGFHVGVVQVLGRHVENRIRAAEPAQRALDAGVKVDHRPHGPSGEFLEGGVAVRTPSAVGGTHRVLHGTAGLHAGYGNALTHLMP